MLVVGKCFSIPFTFLVASRGHRHTHARMLFQRLFTQPRRVCTNHAGHVVSPLPCRQVGGWVSNVRVCTHARACLLADGGGCGIEEALSAALREVALAGDRASRLEARLPLKKTSDIHLQLRLKLPKPRTPGRHGENT